MHLGSRERRIIRHPQWEHDHRCHGLWTDRRQRLAYVGLTPPGHPLVYSWALDAVPEEHGECSTLRAAKRRVWAAYRRHYSWIFHGAEIGLWKLVSHAACTCVEVSLERQRSTLRLARRCYAEPVRYLLLAMLAGCSVSLDPAGHVIRTPLGSCVRTDNQPFLSGHPQPVHDWYCEVRGVRLIMWSEP